jgi:hypothetical protein
MPLPTNGFRQPVVICDETGNSVGMIYDAASGVWRLAVDCSLAVAANIAVDGNIQVQNDELVPLAAVLAGATWNGAVRDCQNYAGFGISVYLARIAADTNVDVVIETSRDNGATWRQMDRQTIALSAAAPTANFNRVYSPTRRYMRVSLVNGAANVNAEVVTLLKPIP